MLRNLIRKEWLILIILFMGISGLLGSRWSLYILISLYPILFNKSQFKKYCDSTFFLFLLFSISYAIIFYINSNSVDVGIGKLFYYSLYPPVFYLVGAYFVEKWHSEKYLSMILLIVIIGYSFLYLNNALQDAFKYELVNYSRTFRANTNDTVLGYSFQGIRASLSIAGIGLLFVPTIDSIEKRFKFVYVILGCIGIFVVAHYINRTGLVIACCCIFFVICKLIKKKSTLLIFFITSILVVLLINYLSQLFNLHQFVDAYQSRENNSDYNFASFGGRNVRWFWVIENIFSHPFGGIVNYRYGYAHNLWLDSARIAGIIPFSFLCIASIISLIKAIKVIFNKKTPLFFSCLLVALNTAFFLQCFVEPIIEADFMFFCLYVMFFGMQNHLSINLENKKFLS